MCTKKKPNFAYGWLFGFILKEQNLETDLQMSAALAAHLQTFLKSDALKPGLLA